MYILEARIPLQLQGHRVINMPLADTCRSHRALHAQLDACAAPASSPPMPFACIKQ